MHNTYCKIQTANINGNYKYKYGMRIAECGTRNAEYKCGMQQGAIIIHEFTLAKGPLIVIPGTHILGMSYEVYPEESAKE